MSVPRSNLPKSVTEGYWVAVGKSLRNRRQLSREESLQAISKYRAVLAEDQIGDIIYHDPIEETADGIVTGGYVPSDDQPGLVSESTQHANR